MDQRTGKRGIGLVLILLVTGFAQAQEPATPAGGMTCAQAKARIPVRSLPEFWVGDVQGLAGRFERLQRGKAALLGVTPGGRPIYLVTYGEREVVAHHANFNSAIGGQDAAAYMDKAARQKPVILLLGPVHGHEVEGLTGLVNLIAIMETGRDLRGRSQAKLRQLGDRCRLRYISA